MKIDAWFMVLAGTTATLIQVMCQTQEPLSLMSDMLKVAEKCRDQTNTTEDVLANLKTMSLPETQEGQCAVACFLQEEGLMKDNQVYIKAVDKFLDELFLKLELPPVIKTVVTSIVNKCEDSGSPEYDECKNAAAFIQCGKDAFEKQFQA